MSTIERAKRFAKALKEHNHHRVICFSSGSWLMQKENRAYRALLKQRIKELPQSVMEDKYQVDCFVRWGLEQALELFDAVHGRKEE